jgi:hypothetical protein
LLRLCVGNISGRLHYLRHEIEGLLLRFEVFHVLHLLVFYLSYVLSYFVINYPEEGVRAEFLAELLEDAELFVEFVLGKCSLLCFVERC